MKLRFLKLFCAALAVGSALLLGACGEKTQSSAAPAATAGDTTPTLATLPPNTTTAPLATQADLTKLHTLQEPGDLFTGYWKITDGTGSQLESFVFAFDGNQQSYLLIGSMGYCATYEVHAKDGKDVFTTQMMFGLNGDYTYAFAKDKQSVVLTPLSGGTATTLQKLDSFSSIPAPPDNPVIDEALLGAWKDETGEYLYFDKSGIFYETQANVAFTFYTYSAADGKLETHYTMKDAVDETASYKVQGNTLTYNKSEYTRIAADELV